MDLKHYSLLYNMGLASQPVVSPQNPCYPSYIMYTPPCVPAVVPPPLFCDRDLHDHTLEELLELINEFTTAFPELKKDPYEATIYLPFLHKLACMYPDLTCVSPPCEKYKFFLLLAHYYSLQNSTSNDSINAISSSSVGDVSISYDTTHTQKMSPFFVWLSKTPYGRDLIALLKSKPGIVVV